MEVYILDDVTMERREVIDQFESLIWTERYNQLGDFKLIISSDPTIKERFKENTVLAVNESYRCMVVENVEDTTSADGKATLTVTGRSLELWLQNRVALGVALGTAGVDGTAVVTSVPATWDITGTPGAVARKIFTDICVTGTVTTRDRITMYTPGTFLPPDTIAEPVESLTFKIPPKSVYDAIKEICETYELGYRLIRHPLTNMLYFNIYTGRNLTTQQSSFPPVVFSPTLDNLSDTKEFTTVEEQKNCAYVYHSGSGRVAVVYNDDTPPSTVDFQRKVLIVDASELTGTPTLTDLQNFGKKALVAYRGSQTFDGEIDQNSQYKYGIDYNLGDMVEARNATGFSNQLRVTEQIFSSDSSGDKSYPTLSKSLSIPPGSWLSWDAAKTWAELLDSDLWNTMPT